MTGKFRWKNPFLGIFGALSISVSAYPRGSWNQMQKGIMGRRQIYIGRCMKKSKMKRTMGGERVFLAGVSA